LCRHLLYKRLSFHVVHHNKYCKRIPQEIIIIINTVLHRMLSLCQVKTWNCWWCWMLNDDYTYWFLSRVSPELFQAPHIQGYVHVLVFHFTQAKGCLTQAIACTSANELSYIMLGKIYLSEGNVTAAIDTYKIATAYSYTSIIHILL